MIRALVAVPVLLATLTLTGCQFFAGSAVSPEPRRQGQWQCTDGAQLTIVSNDGMLAISDSRGVEVVLPPDPPGQRERYAKTGYALVFDGVRASWFAAGQRPADCQRR